MSDNNVMHVAISCQNYLTIPSMTHHPINPAKIRGTLHFSLQILLLHTIHSIFCALGFSWMSLGDP